METFQTFLNDFNNQMQVLHNAAIEAAPLFLSKILLLFIPLSNFFSMR